MNMKYELIIIGGGPAGASAAVYAARKQLKTLIITPTFGGQSGVSPEIYNWIGTPVISGANLDASFEKHVREYDGEFLTIATGEHVTSVDGKTGDFTVTTDKDTSYEGKTILAVAGSSRRKLSEKVTGAEVFENKGVVYCASCDGPLFSGMDVVVIGGGNAGFESAAQLLAYCKSVTLLQRSDAYKADEITVDKVLANPKMTGILNAEIQSVEGDKFVTGVTYKDLTNDEVTSLPVSGVFVEIGQIPNTTFLSEIVDLDDYGRVVIDPWTQRAQGTEGVWAAGDCTNVLYHQNNIAAGDGVRALEDLYLYIQKKW